MPIIIHKKFIQAPINLCFDLARNVEVHTRTTSKTKERAVAGVTSGLLVEGDIVTWEATHLGVKQRLTAKVIHMEAPTEFIDIMVSGAFHSFTHKHQFIEDQDGTWMIDTFEYRSPFGVIGIIADKLFLKKYMQAFLTNRANELKKLAESLSSSTYLSHKK
ncbi:cell division protein [Ornithinibacillus sp. L9]|uniref:Cell division protein n=1 Tax=Ornithinibacillus caprae TaxID=2678566 RepID=A0A6N8FLL2_9BACI|nr:SRPBCC family protein [Ornithinibacillus caprae]MUK90532.1 cell division protein [Ornithinibacillus caprae]